MDTALHRGVLLVRNRQIPHLLVGFATLFNDLWVGYPRTACEAAIVFEDGEHDPIVVEEPVIMLGEVNTAGTMTR